MKILHTADWHLGQTFYQYDRFEEHQHFLDWLLQTIENEQVDVLLVSGDIFDTANASAQSIRQFYHFLSRLQMRFPSIQAIFIAGNHDSPVRLEMPKPLLESTHIQLVGYVKRQGEDKAIDYNSLIIPLYDLNQNITAVCLAVPFLRLGDYPKNQQVTNDYEQGISDFYQKITEIALEKYPNTPLLAMGHLHALGAELETGDTAERSIIGGITSFNASNFHNSLKYIALGHIHKPQKVAGNPHIRYAGSPIPLSFSEKNYNHQVIVFELSEGEVKNIQPIEIPIVTPLISVPNQHKNIEEVLKELDFLADFSDTKNPPYLEVKVLLSEPIPDLKTLIQNALAHKNVKLARIDAKFATKRSENQNNDDKILQISDLSPYEVLQKVYQNKYNTEIPLFYKELFDEILQNIEI